MNFNNKFKVTTFIALALVLGACSGGELPSSTSNSISSSSSSSSISSSSISSYLITFVNYDDSVLYTTNVIQGQNAIYVGATPTRPATSEFTYVFTGWDRTLTNITAAFTTKAQFSTTTNTYTVTWQNHDGTTLETDSNIPYGTTPTYDGATPIKDGNAEFSYSFTGWSPTIASVTGNITYTAQFAQSIILEINDVFFRQLLKQTFDLENTQPITSSMMLNLVSLTITNGIKDVTGIEYASNLESISIQSDNVLGLDELSSLPNLKQVEFGFNKQINVSFLKDCLFIERIVFNNSVFVDSDASYLVMPPNLKSIFYYEFSGKGINFLATASNLETITIYHAFGSSEDLSFLLDLASLEIITILIYFSLSDSQSSILEQLVNNGVQVVLM